MKLSEMSHEETRMKDGICPKCQAEEVIPAVRIVDQLGIQPYKTHPASLSVRLEGSATSGMLTSTKPVISTELRAWVCGACGYSELYATDRAVARL
jgi:predicted nucleic-acid-binding Zn-ribbon protein